MLAHNCVTTTMAFVIEFDGTPTITDAWWHTSNNIDRSYIHFKQKWSRGLRTLMVDCQPVDWKVECTEQFTDKTKNKREWSWVLADNVLQCRITDIFDALEDDNAIEWEYLQPEYGWLDIDPEIYKDVHSVCVAVFAAAGFSSE